MKRAPQRRVGWKLKGYRLSRNRKPVSDLLSTPACAKTKADELADHPLEWRCRATNPEGHDYWEGLHPEILEFEARFPVGSQFSNERQEAYSVEDTKLRERLGDGAWWDRWQIEPEYDAIVKPVKGGIRPNPSSAYYAAPTTGGFWGVFNEGSDSVCPIESHQSQADAIDAAARLAAGRRTFFQERSARREAWSLAFVLLLIALGCTAVIISG